MGQNTRRVGGLELTSDMVHESAEEVVDEVIEKFHIEEEKAVPVTRSPEKNDTKQLRTLPREILKAIVSFAMTAKGAILKMPCLTPAVFRPGINLSCLLLDRDLYHTARHALYQENTFVFSNFGSDIKAVTSCVGLLDCRIKSCTQGGPPVIENVIINLGCTFNPERGSIRIQAFNNVLNSLKGPLQVRNLTIQLENYAWRSDAQVRTFSHALANVQVHHQLIITGLDVHLELRLRELPLALGMSLQPVESSVTFRGPGWQQLGKFECRYEILKCAHHRGSFEQGEGISAVIDDPAAKYHEWLKTATQACVVNGLDYVTELGYSTY